jgi:pathogenicity locus Cdd1 protein
MKNPDRKTVSQLESLPNIGPGMANDLRLLGIQHPQQLIGKNAYQMHRELCKRTNTKHDPCVIDIFLAVVDFMEGGNPAPWWHFTKERKKYLSRK